VLLLLQGPNAGLERVEPQSELILHVGIGAKHGGLKGGAVRTILSCEQRGLKRGAVRLLLSCALHWRGRVGGRGEGAVVLGRRRDRR
jgi:hypothetical protein